MPSLRDILVYTRETIVAIFFFASVAAAAMAGYILFTSNIVQWP